MRAVVIGPGRIGCGFAAQLLRESGWDVTFVGRGPVVQHLQRTGCYVVRLSDGAASEEIEVRGISALSVTAGPAVADAIAKADLVVTAVGAANLAAIAAVIAAGLARRRTPTNVVAFENLMLAGPHLREQVAAHLPRGRGIARHGFSGAVVSRAVSHRHWPVGDDEPLVFVGDRPSTFAVDGAALRGPLPVVAGMQVVDDYQAHVCRKLYTYSAGHAACAYLGYLKGYHFVHTAIRDPEIRTVVREAMAEGQRGLAARYGDELAGTDSDLDGIIDRFANARLADPIVRVGRDPRRKLSADDRLVGAARMAAECGRSPASLALTMAAAMVFCDPADETCTALHRDLQEQGIAGVLRSVCGLSSDDALGRLVADELGPLVDGWADGNLMLSLERRQWSWSAALPVAAGTPAAAGT